MSNFIYTISLYKFRGFQYQPANAIFPQNGTVTVTYRAASPDDVATESFTPQGLKFDLTPQFAEIITPGSINFSVGGKNYFDQGGRLYYDLDQATGAAILSGTINYQNGNAVLSAWVPGQPNTLALRSLLTSLDYSPVDQVTLRVPAVPIRPGSFSLRATRVTGGLINVTADLQGNIQAAGVGGFVEYESGVVRVRFGRFVAAAGNEMQPWYDVEQITTEGLIFRPEPVFAETIRYNAVAFSYLPLDASLLGLDPVRLPQDGRVPIFRPGSFAVIGNTMTTVPQTVMNGSMIDVGRERLSRIRVLDANGFVISLGFMVDLEAGIVTFTNVSGYAQPVRVEHRVEDLLLVSDAQINGDLAFTRQITHNYPANSSFISTALIAGDLKARVSVLFDQNSWDGSFVDTVVGAVATGTYNDILSPLIVTNAGASTERWALRFTSSSGFQIIGEHVGIIGTGSINIDTAPTNPATGEPYFIVRAIGWGIGWATGNVLRFNTVGALFPVWAVRTVQQGPETVQNDSFTLLVRGDVDRP